jgi:hypothetical protein
MNSPRRRSSLVRDLASIRRGKSWPVIINRSQLSLSSCSALLSGYRGGQAFLHRAASGVSARVTKCRYQAPRVMYLPANDNMCSGAQNQGTRKRRLPARTNMVDGVGDVMIRKYVSVGKRHTFGTAGFAAEEEPSQSNLHVVPKGRSKGMLGCYSGDITFFSCNSAKR